MYAKPGLIANGTSTAAQSIPLAVISKPAMIMATRPFRAAMPRSLAGASIRANRSDAGVRSRAF